MTSLRKPAGGAGQTFPPQVQHVAFVKNWAEPSGRLSRLVDHAALAVPGGLEVRVHSLVSAFAASLLVLAPVHALAQTGQESVSVRDRPRPEYDPLGMRLGGFNLNASLDFGIASTDNLFAEEDAFADDDMIYTVSPNARLSSNWSRHALTIEAGADSTSHEDFSSEDSESYRLRGIGRLDVGARSSLTAIAGVAHEVEPRTDPDAPLTLDPVEYDRTNMSVAAQHSFNRFRVTGEVARTEYNFDGTQSFRDNEETVLRGRLDAEITPRVGLLVEASADERDYENFAALNSEGRTFLVGATINLTDLMEGEVSVGQFERDYDAGFSTDGLAVAAQVEWYVTRLTTLTFNVNRDAEDVIGGAFGLPYVSTQYGARVDHELMRNVILTGGVRAGQREYDIIDREDEFVSADVGADYILNRRVALRARYQHDEVDSSGAASYRDYEVNTLSLGLSLRL